MDRDIKTGTSKKKSILDTKSETVGDEMDSPSNPDEKEMEEFTANISDLNKSQSNVFFSLI